MPASSIELAALRKPSPDESADYARARQSLLAEEIELQRHLDRVAALRRELPPGPLIKADYRLSDPNGTEVRLIDLFGDKNSLLTYFWMYGPERARPCPMCTNLLGPLNANANDLRQRVALAVFGRSPVERQIAFAQERGWHHLAKRQPVGDGYALHTGESALASKAGCPLLAVVRQEGDAVRLFWKGEMTGEMADPGKDPRGGPDFAPLWTALDLTPEGRGETWYPKLEYD